MANKKVLVIGIDGATFKILDKLENKNKIPFISSFKKNGAYGVLESTIPSISAPAWATFQTGVNPGKHSVYDFFYNKNNEKHIINAGNIKQEKLWEYLGKEDKKCLLVNMPISYPVSPINGVIVSSFLTPKNKKYIYPDYLEEKLKKLDYEIDIFLGEDNAFVQDKKMSEKQKKKVLKKLINIAEKRAKAFLYLYKKDNYDFSFIYFKGSDIIQHLDFDGKLTEEYYAKLDKIIKKLVLKIDNKNLYKFIISDHGFHKTPNYEFFADKWLKENFDYSKDTRELKTFIFLSKINIFLKKLNINIANIKIYRLFRDKVIKDAEVSAIGEDQIYKADVKGVYIQNSQNTNILNIIKKARLLKYKNKKVFQKVGLRRDFFSGKFAREAPHIVWMANEEFVVNPTVVAKSIFGTHTSHLKGEHYSDPKGVWFASGKGIKVVRATYKLQDVLPTILSIFEIDISKKIDGRVMNIFNKKVNKKVSEKIRLNNLVNKQFENVRN